MKKLLILFLFLAIRASAQTYPDINYSRPRIYVDSARFAWIQTNIGSGDCATTFTNFENAMNGWWYNDPQLYLEGNDSTLWTWNFNSQFSHDEAIFTAALYKITNDTLALKRIRFIIDQINNRFDTLNYSNYAYYTNEGTIRWLSDVGGILLDWCYDDLPVPMRQSLVQTLYAANRYFMDTYITSSNGNSYISSHNAWNNIFANQFALVLDSADGLTPQQNDTVWQWYQITYDKWVNGFEPCYAHYRDDDGGWNWTAAYSMWSLIDQFQFFENMRIATGKNFYTDLPWVLNSINQYWYMIQPDSWTINWGDGFTDIHADRVSYLHARYFNDPRSLWLVQYWSMPPNLQLYNYTAPLYNKLMFKDFNMPVVTKPDIAHDWWSDKTGLSVSRTGWEPTDAMVWFFNSPSKKAAHEHRDNNSFCVFKNKPQIINSGYYYAYGDAHYLNYYMRTVSKNSILVYDSTDQYTNWGVNVSNDGGQNESPTLFNYNDIFLPQFQKGNWVLWGSGTNYNYNIADASLSYDTAKVNRFVRRVLFRKPDQVIVLDHVGLNNIATQQRDLKWGLHFQNEPVISGNNISSPVPGHIETFDGIDIFQSNGNGNVAVRTLLPANTTTTKIGGVGYEFYVDGMNYPVAGGMDTVHTTPGNWRIEVAPVAPSDSMVLLHTIKIGDATNVAVAGGFGEQNNFTVGADWENTLFFFDAQGDTGSFYQVMNDLPGGRLVDVFGADLIPNNMYDVLIDNFVVTSLSSDASGIVDTTIALGPGMHKVEISHQSLSLEEMANEDELLAVYPNPANSIISVFLDQKLGPETTLDIYNAMGLKVYHEKINHRLIINTQQFASGFYTVIASESALVARKKLIIQH